MSDPLVLTDVEKQYGGLRPLRVRDLRVPAGRITMILGFDRPAAEVFVNLITGASLPDKGEVASLGRPTSAIADSDEWLAFVERFGKTCSASKPVLIACNCIKLRKRRPAPISSTSESAISETTKRPRSR